MTYIYALFPRQTERHLGEGLICMYHLLLEVMLLHDVLLHQHLLLVNTRWKKRNASRKLGLGLHPWVTCPDTLMKGVGISFGARI